MSEEEVAELKFLDTQMEFLEGCEEISARLLEYFERLEELTDQDGENKYVPHSPYLRELKRRSDEDHQRNLAEFRQDCAANTAAFQKNKIIYEQLKNNLQEPDYLPYPIFYNPKTITIGPNGTLVELKIFSSINWRDAAKATRSLLNHLFTPEILATHSLTGKPSPAFYGRERAPKLQLDQKTVEDIIHCVKIKSLGNVRVIRKTIVTRCADAAKNLKKTNKKSQKTTKV